MEFDQDGRPFPPPGCGAAGKALWSAVLGVCDPEDHELLVLAEVADVADHLAVLRGIVTTGGLLGDDGKVAPAVVEQRLQRLLLLRMLADLGIPTDTDGPAMGTASTGSRGSYGRRT